MKLLRTNLETLAITTDEKKFKKLAYNSMLDWLKSHNSEDLMVTVTEIPDMAAPPAPEVVDAEVVDDEK